LVPASSASPAPTIRGRTLVAFDSSFLIAVMEHPTTWMEDIAERIGAYTPILLSSVKQELARIASSPGRKGGFASLALALVDGPARFQLRADGGGRPDDEILSFAIGEGAAVATIDADLAKRLRASRVRTVITLSRGRVAV
jgi:rRNA-processing protein FCF1